MSTYESMKLKCQTFRVTRPTIDNFLEQNSGKELPLSVVLQGNHAWQDNHVKMIVRACTNA